LLSKVAGRRSQAREGGLSQRHIKEAIGAKRVTLEARSPRHDGPKLQINEFDDLGKSGRDTKRFLASCHALIAGPTDAGLPPEARNSLFRRAMRALPALPTTEYQTGTWTSDRTASAVFSACGWNWHTLE
jgi:hypothetical protein